jgi:hypothetical protein
LAHLVSVADGKSQTKVATYTITAPAGGWDTSDNGKYLIKLQSFEVFDAAGNDATAGTLGEFTSIILPPDAIGNSQTAAPNIGAVDPGIVRVKTEGVNTLDRNDYYKIVIDTTTTLSVKLSNMTDNADLWIISSNGVRVFTAKQTGTTPEAFIKILSPGTYFIRVFYTGTAGTSYRLRLEGGAPPPTAAQLPGVLAAAPYLGPVAPGVTKVVNDSVGPSNLLDFYRFSLASTTHVAISLSGLVDNANLAILNSAGSVLNLSSLGGTSVDSLSLNLGAGTYYARVIFAGGTATSYKLQLAAT